MPQEFNGLRCHSVAIPIIPVGHPKYVWRNHADVDVQRTWRSYGWKPQSEIAATAQERTAAQVMRPVWKKR